MCDVDINLIRDRVLPAPKRKAVFVGITLCLIAYIGILALGVHGAVKKLVASVYDQRRIVMLEKHFRAKHETKDNSSVYVRQLQGDLERSMAQIAAVNGILGPRTDLARVIIGLHNQLPPGVHIMNLELDKKNKSVNVELLVTTAGSSAEVTVGELVDAWNADPHLKSQVKEIRSVSRQTRKRSESPVSVWEFSCLLGKSGV